MMPALGGENDGAVGSLRTKLLLRIAPDVVFNLLALPVQFSKLRRQSGGLCGILGEHQFFCLFGLTEAARSVQARRQGETDKSGIRLAGERTGFVHDGVEARARIGLQLLKPSLHQVAIFTGQRHHVGDGPHGDKVGIALQNGKLISAAGADQLECNTDTGEMRICIGVVGTFGVDNGTGLRDGTVFALMVVGNHKIEAEALGKNRLFRGGYAAVNGDDEGAALFPEPLQGRGVQTVTFVTAVGDVPAAIHTAASQIVRKKAGGGDAIHVIVAVDRDTFLLLNRPENPVAGFLHPQYAERIQQTGRSRAVERVCPGRRDNSAGSENLCQQSRNTSLFQRQAVRFFVWDFPGRL